MRLYALVLVTGLSAPLSAQQDGDTGEDEASGGLLVGMLEDLLSNEHSSIRVIGLEGALSSRATIEKLTVADDSGVWLSVSDAVLDWNRLALLRGRFSVNALSAGEIRLERLPEPAPPDPSLPVPEAQPFSLPELPVAVEIGQLAVPRIALGKPVIGLAADLSLDGKLLLADGMLDSTLALARLDKAGDDLNLTARFDNENRQVTVDLALNEAEGGLVTELLGVPDRPSLRMEVKGQGPVSDFTADIGLASDGVERVGGQIRLQGADTPGGGGGIAFAADIAGDITPLLTPELRGFFGTETSLGLDGHSGPDGRLELSSLDVSADALRLSGAVTIAQGKLDKAQLDGRITPPAGDAVVLPLGTRTTLQGARLALDLDRSVDDGWDLSLDLDGLEQDALSLQRAELTATGTLGPDRDTAADGTFDATLTGLGFADTALAQAVGDTVGMTGGFRLLREKVIELTDIDLAGADYRATVDGRIDGLDSGFNMTGSASATADNLSRFGALAGQDLGGAITARVDGVGAPLSGMFDVKVQADATDLAAGIDMLDPLIEGASTLHLDAARDETGLSIRDFGLRTPALDAQAEGAVRTSGTDLTLSAALDDLARVLPQASGPLTLSGDLAHGDTWSGKLRLDAPNESFADIEGSYDPQGSVELTYAATVNRIETYVPQIEGTITSRGTAQRQDGSWQIDSATDGSAGITAQIAGTLVEATGVADMLVQAGFDDLGRLVPALPGAARLNGRAARDADGVATAQLRLDAPKGISAVIDADAQPDGAANVTFSTLVSALDTFVPQLAGALSADGTARRRDGAWDIAATTGGSAGIAATVDAGFDEATGDAEATFDATLARLERLVPTMDGSARLRGQAARTGAGDISGRVNLDGPHDSRAEIAGELPASGDAKVTLSAAMEQLERLVKPLEGSLTAQATARRRDGIWQIDGGTGGSAGISADVIGKYAEATGAAQVALDAELARLERLAPPIKGSGRLAANVDLSDTGTLGALARFDGPSSSYAELTAELFPEGEATVIFDAELAALERFMPQVSGAVHAKGTGKRDKGVWQIASDARGPAGITADLAGSFNETSGEADIAASGRLLLGIANQFMTPNAVDGAATYDITLKGKPAVENIAGTVATSGASLVIPDIGQSVTDINASIGLADGSANVDLSGSMRAGGRFTVTGPVALAPPFEGNLAIALNQLGLTDNVLFTSVANGQLSVAGPLMTNPRIAGRIDFGETNIDLNNVSGSIGAAPIPPIRHVSETGAQYATRERAGLVKDDSGGGGGVVVGLDITLSAPDRVKVSGRGLQSELGGEIHIGGTSEQMVPSGRISLIRGTFDLFGSRLELDEGRVSLQGDFEPYIDFAASTSTDDGQATIRITGPMETPEIVVTSVPDRPTEEALAMLIFGTDINDISPLKLAQIAAQAASLSGAGNKATDTLATGLFDLGGYLTDNLYTDVEVNAKGEAELQLNLDVTDHLTLRGTADNAGDTGIGVFFSRDY
ncbi:translocation/assembly module TamB domain-containing protein [Pukyongiella litopenaei]|nr:translocation/assembly module TamB domain-containing protein [Pukyongiella litopenaei]